MKKASKKTKRVSKGRERRKLELTPLFNDTFWSRGNILAAITLFIVSFALYIPALDYDYILDDKIVISENNFTKEGIGGIWDILSRESFEGYLGEQQDLVEGGRYRPLSIVTFALEVEFFGLNPTVSHIVNGLLYGLTAVLIFRLMFLLVPLKNRTKTNWLIGVPFITAILFAVHPIHTEVVANIKGRDEIMAFLGALAALYFSFRYVDKKSWLHLVWVFAFLFLGLMSKENAITFLAVIPAALYFFTDRPIKQILPVFGVSLLAAALYLIIRTSVIGYLLSSGQEITDLMNNPFIEMNGPQKAATIMFTLGKYVQLLFNPHPLSHDYYPYAIAIQEWVNPWVLISLGVYLLMAVVAILGLRKKSFYSFWIIYFLATLSIVSNVFFPVGTFMNERFIYISSFAYCAILTYFFMKDLPDILLPGRKWVKPVSIVVMAIHVFGFAIYTQYRIPAWSSPEALNSSAVIANPNSARANLFYGTVLFNKYRDASDQDEKNRFLNMADHFIGRSLQIHPSYNQALQMSAGIAAERYRNHSDLDRLLMEFKKVLEVNPRIQFVREYMEYLNQRVWARDKLTDFYYDLSYNYLMPAGFINEAAFYLQYGLEVGREDARINYAIGVVMEKVGRLEESAFYLQRAFELDPDNARIHYAIGRVMERIGRTEDSLYYLERAKELDPTLFE